jgi:hypothetical protein
MLIRENKTSSESRSSNGRDFGSVLTFLTSKKSDSTNFSKFSRTPRVIGRLLLSAAGISNHGRGSSDVGSFGALRDRGTYAMEDTDSMAVVATKNGGVVPCQGGTNNTIKALSWKQVKEISARPRLAVLRVLWEFPPTAGSRLNRDRPGQWRRSIETHPR